MKLFTVEFLKKHMMSSRLSHPKEILDEALEKLKETYGIKANFSSDGQMLSLKYDQLESPKDNKIVRECRGLVLDSWTLGPVCIQFNRFFNYGESGDDITIDNMLVVEKHDGSLMSIYYHLGQWNCCTSGTPTAETNVGDWDITFKDLFWKAFKGDKSKLKLDHTYTFELVSPHNKVVRDYAEPDLVLLGARKCHMELDWAACNAIAMEHGFTRPEVYDLKDIDSIIESWKHLKPQEEGYVAVDYTKRNEFGNFKRCKIKNPAYVALHRLKDSSCNSRRALLEVVLTGEMDEIITYFPEYQETIRDFENKVNKLIKDHDEFIAQARDEGWPPQQIGPRAGQQGLIAGWVFTVINGKAVDTKDVIREGIKSKGLKCFARNLLKRW
jgi:hypothetical protein